MRVVGDDRTGWELIGEDQEPLGVCQNMSHGQALDCFAANWPELAGELDALRVDDLCGESERPERPRRQAGGPSVSRARKKGSGARFRELMAGGASNAEALAIVRAEFPESKATLSDAAWNRARLQKEKGQLGAGPSVEVDVGELM